MNMGFKELIKLSWKIAISPGETWKNTGQIENVQAKEVYVKRILPLVLIGSVAGFLKVIIALRLLSSITSYVEWGEVLFVAMRYAINDFVTWAIFPLSIFLGGYVATRYVSDTEFDPHRLMSVILISFMPLWTVRFLQIIPFISLPVIFLVAGYCGYIFYTGVRYGVLRVPEDRINMFMGYTVISAVVSFIVASTIFSFVI